VSREKPQSIWGCQSCLRANPPVISCQSVWLVLSDRHLNVHLTRNERLASARYALLNHPILQWWKWKMIDSFHFQGWFKIFKVKQGKPCWSSWFWGAQTIAKQKMFKQLLHPTLVMPYLRPPDLQSSVPPCHRLMYCKCRGWHVSRPIPLTRGIYCNL